MARGRSRRKAPAQRGQHQTRWAIITFDTHVTDNGGYYLDSFVTGSQVDANREAEAARSGAVRVPGAYSHSFAAPLKQGFARFSGRQVKPMDVWLHRRTLSDRQEYMVKVTAARDDPVAPPEEGGWSAILISQAWLPPEQVAKAKARIRKIRRGAKKISL
jgi:hypothetical protein